MGKASSLEEIQEFILSAGSDNISVFSGRFEGGVHCQQVPDEFAAAIAAIRATGREIKNYLEIGVAAGGTTYHINYYFTPEKIVLIDDNLHIKAPLRGEILRGVRRREIIGKSGADLIQKEIAALKMKFDLMVIDGDHTYAGVKADVDNYLPYLADGGFVLFHDTALPDWGVMAVVAELKGSKDLDLVGEYNSKIRAPLGIALFSKNASTDSVTENKNRKPETANRKPAPELVEGRKEEKE